MSSDIQTILFKAKEEIYTSLSGGNLSKILGQGYDFAELREYESSDDIRHISWINSAKLGKPYVKKMHEEKELNVAVCSLIDGRFAIGVKRRLLIYILAILGYSSYEANNLFLSIIMHGKELKLLLPTKNIDKIEEHILQLHNIDLLGSRIDYTKVASTLWQKVEQRSLLFIIGDFLDPIDLSLLSQKHEVIAIIVRDSFEEHPTLSPTLQLINPQTNRPINQILNKRAIAHYRRKLLEHDRELLEHFAQYNIRYTKISYEEEVLGKLVELFFI